VRHKSAIHVRGPLIRLGAFTAICLAVMSLLAIQLSGMRFTDERSYGAVFDNVSALKTGDEVRIAGVRAGQVSDVVISDGTPRVEFAVNSDITLPRGVRAVVRYKNLFGDRYLELRDGPGPPGTLAQGQTIPRERTAPALDLDALMNGFQPLFSGLEPDQINELSTELITVLQGEGGTIEDLLTHVGSLTNTLADQDKTIGRFIVNFNRVLSTVNEHGPELDDALLRLQKLTSGLARDRGDIGASFDKIARITGSFTETLRAVRPSLRGTVDESAKTLAAVEKNKALLDENLRYLPKLYTELGRPGVRGSFTATIICSLRMRFSGHDGPVYTPWLETPNERCAPGGR
jgi:phospholipid/cholesterol/gamma-HCH transport system substrate-binding protein